MHNAPLRSSAVGGSAGRLLRVDSAGHRLRIDREQLLATAGRGPGAGQGRPPEGEGPGEEGRGRVGRERGMAGREGCRKGRREGEINAAVEECREDGEGEGDVLKSSGMGFNFPGKVILVIGCPISTFYISTDDNF